MLSEEGYKVTDKGMNALRAWDYHTMWVNTRALEVAGITADTPDPPLGEIPHHDHGHVDGLDEEVPPVDTNPNAMNDNLHPVDKRAHDGQGDSK